MKSFAIAFPALLLVSLVAAAVPLPTRRAGPAVNLVVNGSFEDGPNVEVYRSLDPGSTDLKGWSVTRGQIDVVQETKGQWKAAHGARLLDLHGSPGFGGVSQKLATHPGQRYRVTFQMSGNPGVAHEKVQIAVRAAGRVKEFEIPMAGRSYEDLKWEAKTWEFTAGDRETVIEFHTAMPPTANGFGGPLVDDVKVVEIE